MPTVTLNDGRVMFYEQDCRFVGCLPVDASKYRQIAGPGMPPPASSGPRLGLRRGLTSSTAGPSGKSPCEAFDAARAAGQSQAVVNALGAKCEAWRAEQNEAAGVADGLYGDEEKAAGISPVIIAAGVVGVGLLAFKLIKG